MRCDHRNKEVAVDLAGDKLFECRRCGLVFSKKFLENFEPDLLYNDYYHNKAGASVDRFIFGVESIVTIFRFARALKIYFLAGRKKKILDIGCGRGWTLYFLKKYFNYEHVVGTQISRPAFEHARGTLKLEVYDKDLLDLKIDSEVFDLVTMWHVLEHVKDPEAYIEKIHQLLRPRGYFIVEVPNLGSWTRNFVGKYWLGYDLKYHLTFYSKNTLLKLLMQHGFEIKKVRTFSLEYSTYISAQSILSKLTNTEQVLFGGFQGKRVKAPLLFFHTVCMSILVPLCFIINIALYFSSRGEVLHVIAQKSKF